MSATRIGHGFDAHRLVADRPLVLGGVEVPHDKGLEGHSDGDVLLHAVASALLGALGEGDLGTHFPSSDPALAGIASSEILARVAELLRAGGLHVGYIDTTLVAQEPRLGPHLEKMRSSLASVLGVGPERVNVKVTSTDGLGAIGRGEGIACHAVALLTRGKLEVYDSLSREVREFEPLRPGEVRIYSCGPTVYKRAHIGNFRAFVLSDLLRRTFEYLGYRVTQIMNITDVGHLTEDDVADAQGEDRLQKEAAKRNLDPWQIAREEEANFKEDSKVLGLLEPNAYPRATEHVPEMIAMIESLLEKGHAYEVDGNVYFDVRSFDRYGELSGNTLDDVSAGASGRVEDREDKRNPEDFALWKRDEKHLMQWDSPWGRGFPGWHIECSAMSRKYLGDTLDIHSGGQDNKFPHHECEIAQTEGVTGKPFVRTWMHCGWLEIGGAKMAKREGKIYTIPELVDKGYDGKDLRLYLLKQHYRAPLPFSLELLDEAKTIRARLANFVSFEMADRPEGESDPAVASAIEEARSAFRAALEDDLNTSGALAAVHGFVTSVNRLSPCAADAKDVVAFMREIDSVLGILDDAPDEGAGQGDAELDALLAQREAARGAKDWAEADRIRDELLGRGIEVIDTPQGPRWRRR